MTYERFTERARQVVVLAGDEARSLNHAYVGTEHVLLGLLREEEGLAAQVLAALNISTDRVRKQVIRIVGHGDSAPDKSPLTPRAKKVFELALREALSLGHNYIGTEHILLGLVRENEGVAARILLDFDADSEKIRNEVIRTLTRRKAQTQVSPLKTGELRPFRNGWLLKAVLQQALRDLETEALPPNVITISLAQTLENFRRGLVDTQ